MTDTKCTCDTRQLANFGCICGAGEYFRRGFEKVSVEEWERATDGIEQCWRYEDIILPMNATENSAGCDIFSPISFVLTPQSQIKIPTGFRAWMMSDEMLNIYPRSSLGVKGMVLANTVAVGDSDYYMNETNEGHYFLILRNIGQEKIKVAKSDRIAQAIFQPFLRSNRHISNAQRTGGLGHTGR